MNHKLFYTILIFSTLSMASTKSIDNKISLNNKKLINKKSQEKYTSSKIKLLAKKIKKQEKEYSNIDKKLSNLNTIIFLNKVKLNKIKFQISQIELNSKNIKEQTTITQNDMIDEIANKYSATIGISLAKKQTINEIIDKEIYSLLLKESSDKILKLNLQYMKYTTNKNENIKKILKLKQYIKTQEEKISRYKRLKSKKQIVMKKLIKQHKEYQNKLKLIISKQKTLQDLLSELDILKIKIRKENRKQKIDLKTKRKKRIKISHKERLREEMDIEIRNLGSSSRGIKISRYRGRKTISPLKSYTVVKKFGKYYDPVYKIKLFNESLSMKSDRPNSKVYNVFDGKIVYSKENTGMLENAVIVKHSNGLYTIYSHLSRIAPTLKNKKWIKKGFVIGRVDNTLMFQVTKNNRYINPLDLFK